MLLEISGIMLIRRQQLALEYRQRLYALSIKINETELCCLLPAPVVATVVVEKKDYWK